MKPTSPPLNLARIRKPAFAKHLLKDSARNGFYIFQIKQQWIAPKWEAALKDAYRLDIEALTTREFNWFEEPNRRRGGWIGVTRIVLNPDAAAEKQKAVFLKIQQNHFYRAPATFFLKRLSFAREFDALQMNNPF